MVSNGLNIFTLWTGLGLVAGAAIGVVFFALTSEAWLIVAGVGFGLLLGAVYGLYRKNQQRLKVLHARNK